MWNIFQWNSICYRGKTSIRCGMFWGNWLWWKQITIFNAYNKSYVFNPKIEMFFQLSWGSILLILTSFESWKVIFKTTCLLEENNRWCKIFKMITTQSYTHMLYWNISLDHNHISLQYQETPILISYILCIWL